MFVMDGRLLQEATYDFLLERYNVILDKAHTGSGHPHGLSEGWTSRYQTLSRNTSLISVNTDILYCSLLVVGGFIHVNTYLMFLLRTHQGKLKMAKV